MLSPSLTTAILHVVSRRLLIPPELLPDANMFKYLRQQMKALNVRWCTLPVVGRTDRPEKQELLGEHIDRPKVATDREGSRQSTSTFFWGEVPVNKLVAYAAQRGDVSGSQEILDLGTGFTPATADADHDDAETICRRLLAKTATIEDADSIVGFVDVGVSMPNHQPDTYDGKLTHLNSDDVLFSAHAIRVLAVLLDRLERRNILNRVHVVCCLVVQSDPIFSSPFKRGSSPQILSALTSMFGYVNGRNIPASINLSMGTHVGPHNGQSPLEELASQVSSTFRTLHVSGGNDGLRGIHAVRRVRPDSSEDLVLQTGPAGDDFLLTEFWWSDECGPLSIEVLVLGPEGRPVLTKPVLIDSTRPKAELAPYGPDDPRLTLVANRCYGAMSCISFGMTPSYFSNLASLQIQFTLSSSEHPHVHAWIARSSDRRTTFVGSTHDATLCVPATARNVIGVSGAIDDRRAWPSSSRGADPFHPLAAPSRPCHDLFWHDCLAPVLAHRVHFVTGDDAGTSYASPRACADTAELQLRLQSERLRSGAYPSSLRTIAEMLLGSADANWNPRTGFGIVPF